MLSLTPTLHPNGARRLLTLATRAIEAVGPLLPFTPLARPLGLTGLPPLYWPILALTLLCYVGVTQVAKAWLIHRRWI